jgi:cytoskeletal protein RodZ
MTESTLTLDGATTWDVDMGYHTGNDLPSTGIGAQLRQQRLGLGLAIEDIARETRISYRYLEAIERNDFESLPSLIFTRNFVRQFALLLRLDPEPLLTELPTQDEASVRLPDPPAWRRLSYDRGRQLKAALTAVMWLVVAGGAGAAYYYFNHSESTRASDLTPGSTDDLTTQSKPAQTTPVQTTPVQTTPAQATPVQATPEPARPALVHAVQVVITAHEPAWVEMTVDGKVTFTGTLKADEMKEITADEQVKLIAGNAGALTILLNGKTLEPLGAIGQVRVVKLTAEGPQFLVRSPQPEPDPL